MLKLLLSQFIKSNGRKPNNLEMILLRQKASKEAVNERKIVNMFDRQPVDANKPILGGKNIIETDEQMIQRFKKQNEDSINRLKNKKKPEDMAGGGVAGLLGERTGYNEGLTAKQLKRQDTKNLASKIKKLLDIQGSGTMSGKQQIEGEPEGITSNKSFINLIADLNIPISEKISLLGDVQYNKFREKIQKGNDELFLEDPASSINKRLGIGFDSGAGTTASAIKNLETGDNEFRFDIKKPIDFNKLLLRRAEGGPARQNFAMGKRAFLKMLGGVGAGIAGLKSGLLGFGGKQATKKAVSETVKQTAGSGAPPPYFINLVKKIKNLGDDAPNLVTQDRQKVTKFKDYTLTEDITTGSKEVIKKNADGVDEVYMRHSVEDVPTKKGLKKSEEYEELTAKPDMEGKMKDIEQGVPDDVIKEGTVFEDTLSEFGKADGGRIGYAVGNKVIGKGIMAGINKLFGKGTMTTADKIKRPQQALDREMFKKFETNYPETGAADATLNIPVQQEGKFTKAEYLIQRLENTIKQNPKDKYVKETFPNFIKELKDNPELAKNENVFKELGGDLPEGQQIVVYGDDSIDFFTQKSGPGNIDRLKKIMSKYNISKDKALKIMKMEPNDQVMEFKMLEIANRKLNATGGLAAMLGE